MISFNGLSTKQYALADSGATRYLYIDTATALDLVKRLNIPIKTLSQAIPTVRYNAIIKIAVIGAAGFNRHTRKGKNEICVVTLQQIKEVIDNCLAILDPQEAVNLRGKIPKEYHDYLDVFSKKASDQLLPLREKNYRLTLDPETLPGETIGNGPLYKMSIEELEAARQYIIENLDKGFIVPSGVPFASPILMAKKPDGGLRFCVDYRRLNSITQKDRYPLPLIGKFIERLTDTRIFIKIDIRQGFYRIRMKPGQEDLTTFKTRYGNYKYQVMPFGLTNGPATFQRYMNSLFMNMLDRYITVFIDNILIFSKNEAEHRKHIKAVLERLRAAGLQAAIHNYNIQQMIPDEALEEAIRDERALTTQLCVLENLKGIKIVDQVLAANRSAPSLESQRAQAQEPSDN
ncbi:reverse transcriptase family protein [Aspergillus affinis]|uniref:reverse transcriptase family protein n=1 Tax=Aspergillus affinis TaxID=1070780 RepID=UPI0022FEEE9A|nr:Gag/polymerase/env polyprotein [Aspergillus affinis]KAI9035595.1 Gag/polymerase/env polyprotein [Aspergillus affinis]